MSAVLATIPLSGQVQEPATQPPPPPTVQQQPYPDAQPQPAPRTSGSWRKFGGAAAQTAPPLDPQESDVAPPPPDQQQPPQQRPPYQGQAYTGPVPSQLTIPAGTWLKIRVDQPISSDKNEAGDNFSATLTQPVVVNGFVVARRGQTVQGRVSEAVKAGRAKGTSRLGLELMEVNLVDGQMLPVKTQLMEYSGGTSNGRDAAAIGTTTAVGAAIGGAAAGGFGAGMGAIGGAVASTIGVLVTRGHATTIYPEAEISFRTTAPLTINTEQSAHAFEPVRQGDYQQRTLQQRRPQQMGGYGYGPGYYGGGYYGGYYGYPYFYGPGFYGPSFYFRSGPRFYRGGRHW